MAWTSAQRPLQALLVVALLSLLAPVSSQPQHAAAPAGPAATDHHQHQQHLRADDMSQNMTAFFPQVKGDLSQITWAHAVNSQDLLHTALNGSVMMLEADVIMGRTSQSSSEEPVMGHPPNDTSDLSLLDFLRAIIEFNTVHKDAPKGIKLDFKSIGVFEKALDHLKQNFGDVPKFPVWLNADVLSGPVNATTLAVDAKRFLDKAKSIYPTLMLSLGWTTRWGKGLDGEDQSKVPVGEVRYSDENVKEMLAALNESDVHQPITYAVRAAFVANSLKELQELLDKTPQASVPATLTVWSSDDTDLVDVKSLKKNILTLGKHRVYVDVGEKLAKELDLAHSASASAIASVATTVVAALAVMLRGL